MKLMTIIEATPAQSLDQLWHEAEQLGEVEVRRGWSTDPKYEVHIDFRRKSGTRISARGKDHMIAVAVAKAINEAREMGAGVEQ